LLLVFLAIILILIVSGFLYQAWGTASDRRRFPPPGRLVECGGRRWHVIESGEGAPAVVLESGISASCLNWTSIRTEAARFTKAVSYDRASLGWSDPAGTPRLLSELTQELHGVLQAARIPPPYVLTGHSFGGLIVRSYAAKYPNEVAGLILIDPLAARAWLELSEAQARALRHGVNLSRRGAFLAHLGVVRAALALLARGGRRVPQFVAKAASGRGESTISRIVGEVRKMPPETWPMIRAHWCHPKSFRGLADYLESLPASSAEAAALGELPPIPVTILSAANATKLERDEREELLHRSPAGKHIVAPNSGHWIHLDEPDLVLEAIREMVESLRAR
jgi:pimeloyl-ACP methyl ester carboxylesterase